MESLKILFVGNSFAVDTMEHAASVALSLGIGKIKFGTLYVGGCSIAMHYGHAMGDLPAYVYYLNEGEGRTKHEDFRISDAVKSDDWDFIAIQHGSKGGSRYTSIECYDKLTPLIRYIKDIAPSKAKIVFNLAWMGESTYQHHEIISYGGDTRAMRERLVEVTKKVLADNPLIDRFTPVGTAIENARTSRIGLITRDCYHLSMDKGRYIAALTFIAALTGLDIDNIEWAPTGVDEYAKRVAIESARNAIANPFEITESALA